MTCPLLDKSIAIGRVFGKCDMTIVVIINNGTQRNMPGTPQIAPQRARLKRMTTGLRFKDLPVIRGSMILPINTCRAVTPISTVKNKPKSSLDCAKAMSEGNIVATIDPIVGIKLSKKISRPQISAKLMPKTSSKR